MNVTSMLIVEFLNSFPAIFFLAEETPNYSTAEENISRMVSESQFVSDGLCWHLAREFLYCCTVFVRMFLLYLLKKKCYIFAVTVCIFVGK